MTKTLQRRHMFHFGVPGCKGTISHAVPMSYGTEIIRIERVKADVKQGTPGIAVACADMVCALRHKDVFPHGLHYAEFTRTRA